MSISADSSTSAPVFVDGNVVQNVVGLGLEMGLESHFLLLRTRVDEGADLVSEESLAAHSRHAWSNNWPWYR
jgi:hypothetical protein